MKRKIILTFFLTFVLAFMACCVVYADSYDTQLTVGTSADSASEKEIAYRPITGTRYVFRINGEDIGSTSVGGLGSQNYFVNHVRNTTVNSDGINYYNASVSQEKKGVKNDRNWELVYVGWNNNNTVVFKGDKTKYYFFDTPASSLSTYTTELNGEKQFRHVIVWRRKQSLSDTQKAVYNNDFGLNGSDIKKLVEAIKIRAEKLGDQVTLNQLADIEKGKVDFEIRAEILMVLRMPTYKHYKDKLKGATLIREASDCYAYYKLGSLAYYTYREAAWIQNAVNEKTGASYYGAVHNHFGDAASQLFEKDEPYVTEYASEAAASKTEGIKSVRKQWENYYYGWDYLAFENPYQTNQTTVTETAKLKNEDGSETVLLGPTETKITEDTTFTRPENNYTYTGLEFDGGTKSQVSSQLVEADNGTHTIVYWYEVEKKTTITINYKDEKTGKNICPSEMVEPGTHSKKDFEGYDYTGLEIVKPNPEVKDKNKTSVTITDDKETHEITFWYKEKEITKIKVIHKSEGGNILQPELNFTIEEGEDGKTFTQLEKAFGNGYNYIGVDETEDGEVIKTKKQDKDTEIRIDHSGNKTYEITFWYAMQTQVKIIGRCEGKTGNIYSVTLDKENIPLNKTYKESDHKGKDYNASYYTYLNEYEVKLGTHTYLGEKGETSNGNSVQVTVNEATNAPQQILIVFYYKSNFKVDVQHIYVNPITKQEELKGTNTYSIIPDKTQKIPSMQMTNQNGAKWLNVRYEGEDIVASGFVEYGTKSYELTLTPKEKNYTIKLYYTSQTITVKHQKTDGTDLIDPVNKILNPQEEEKTLPEYPFKNWELNETETGTETPKKVSIKEEKDSQELIFYYQDPNLIFGDDDPNGDKNYGNTTYDKLKNEFKTGIIPDDLNNQKIGQKDNEYYWVLNENGGITVRFATTHLEKDSGSCSFVAKVKIPFDVYVNGNSTSEFKINCDKIDEENGYDIYEGTLEKIYVPIWVTEGDYTITANVTQTYTANDSTQKTTSSDTSATVKVVGAVYDFTITNLDGSDTTGDTMWKKSLFGTAKEYKATETAVGQGTQQAKNYNYGIKRGTRFYFSLNTLGQKNKKIEIVPTFYYIDENGNKTKVTMKSNYLTNTRSISLTDTNRTTTEFKNERAKKTGKTNATTFAIGDYNKVTLDSNVNTPYLGIANELLVKQVKTGVTLSDYANHWYGDYAIPNDAKFYKADGTLVSDENGVVAVHFEIKTIDDKNAYYLAYDGDSPFVQPQKISQWNYERQNKNLSVTSNNSITMPKVSTAAAKKVSDVWKIDNSTATIIYSLKANVTTKQNVTSIGTH